MDEILTIRESYINKLEIKVKSLMETIEIKDTTIREITTKLEENQAKLDQIALSQTHERKIRTKVNNSKGNRTHFSKSNERKDFGGIFLLK